MHRVRLTLLYTLILAALSVGWQMPKKSSDAGFGKIYLTDSLLFVGEYFQGVRICDASNPSSLRTIGYIPLAMNSDVAVVGNILYADNGKALLIFDIAIPAHPKLLDSIPDVFQTATWTTSQPVINTISNSGGVSGCGSGCGSTQPVYDRTTLSGTYNSGQGGSMARFAVTGVFLYCIDASRLIAFDISNPSKPMVASIVPVGFDIETLVTDNSILFIGSRTGMYIYDARDVQQPVKLGEFRHARACDPVVIEGDRAYVTLRSTNWCGNTDNAMHVVSITNIMAPVILNSFPMQGPMGLAVHDSIAYVCDVNAVRILDANDASLLTEVASIPVVNAYDCILRNGHLWITAPNGISVYDVRDRAHPVRVTELRAFI